MVSEPILAMLLALNVGKHQSKTSQTWRLGVNEPASLSQLNSDGGKQVKFTIVCCVEIQTVCNHKSNTVSPVQMDTKICEFLWWIRRGDWLRGAFNIDYQWGVHRG